MVVIRWELKERSLKRSSEASFPEVLRSHRSQLLPRTNHFLPSLWTVTVLQCHSPSSFCAFDSAIHLAKNALSLHSCLSDGTIGIKVLHLQSCPLSSALHHLSLLCKLVHLDPAPPRPGLDNICSHCSFLLSHNLHVNSSRWQCHLITALTLLSTEFVIQAEFHHTALVLTSHPLLSSTTKEI